MDNSTNSKNESSRGNSAFRETVVMINCVLNATLMLIAIIGNSLILAAVWRTPSLHLPSITLLCSLAVSDLLVGLVVQPLQIARLLKQGTLLLQIADFITFGCCGVSLYTLTAMSLDRLAALHYHMRYVTMVTTTRVVYTLVLGWLIIFLASVIRLLNESMYLTIGSVFTILCVLIIMLCYIRIFRIVQRHKIQIHAQQQAVQTSDVGKNLNMMRLKKSSMNTLVFCIVLILCYFPMFSYLTILGIIKKSWTPKMEFVVTLVFMNSSINPVLYCWRLRELRTAVVKTARQLLCKTADQV